VTTAGASIAIIVLTCAVVALAAAFVAAQRRAVYFEGQLLRLNAGLSEARMNLEMQRERIYRAEKRLEEQVPLDDMAYVFQSLGVPIPEQAQKRLDGHNKVFDDIMKDLSDLES
jgi:hypothetical protein